MSGNVSKMHVTHILGRLHSRINDSFHSITYTAVPGALRLFFMSWDELSCSLSMSVRVLCSVLSAMCHNSSCVLCYQLMCQNLSCVLCCQLMCHNLSCVLCCQLMCHNLSCVLCCQLLCHNLSRVLCCQLCVTNRPVFCAVS